MGSQTASYTVREASHLGTGRRVDPKRMGKVPGRALSKGFTLLEVMVTSAIIGVLASIAIPIYIDYSMQARTSEGLQMLSEVRRRV